MVSMAASNIGWCGAVAVCDILKFLCLSIQLMAEFGLFHDNFSNFLDQVEYQY